VAGPEKSVDEVSLIGGDEYRTEVTQNFMHVIATIDGLNLA